MEGSEAGSAERNGGVHHPQQERHHRAHLPRGGAHGQWGFVVKAEGVCVREPWAKNRHKPWDKHGWRESRKHSLALIV